MDTAAPHTHALPASLLHHILLTADCTDLLCHVAVCARVSTEWWRVARGSDAYGLGLLLGTTGERGRVLKEISRALRRRDATLSLRGSRIGDAGAAALGAALRAVPTIRFSSLDLARNNLTAAGVASLVPALRRPWAGGLRLLRVGENRDLGDAGVAALSQALSGVSTLEWLNVDSTGCGDDGLAALAAALPALTRLRTLNASFSRAGALGWVALADALPSLPAFERLNANNSPGVGGRGGGGAGGSPSAVPAAAEPLRARLRPGRGGGGVPAGVGPHGADIRSAPTQAEDSRVNSLTKPIPGSLTSCSRHGRRIPSRPPGLERGRARAGGGGGGGGVCERPSKKRAAS
eukprot:COSAG04_NODE_1228_length_7680_cov_39.722200_6_plen_348_part_01